MLQVSETINQIKVMKTDNIFFHKNIFEQYKDLNANLGLLLSVDDLQTDGSASATLKNKMEHFQK